MCQMNPLIGPVLNQRALFAVKKFWVSVIGWTAVAQSTLASKTIKPIIVCNCLIISAMDAVGISIASLLFLKLANPSLFSIYFCLYKHTLKILQKYECEKISLQNMDSNSQSLEHESPPITTRPRLPPRNCFICCSSFSWRQIWSFWIILHLFISSSNLYPCVFWPFGSKH